MNPWEVTSWSESPDDFPPSARESYPVARQDLASVETSEDGIGIQDPPGDIISMSRFHTRHWSQRRLEPCVQGARILAWGVMNRTLLRLADDRNAVGKASSRSAADSGWKIRTSV